MIDLFKVSNQTLIGRLDNLNQLKSRIDTEVNGFLTVKDTASGAEVRVPMEDIDPIIRQQLMLVKDELRRRFG